MGEGAAAKVEEIEVLRGRLDDELAELDRRMPGPSGLAWRTALAAAGGAVLVGGAWLIFRRARYRALAGRAEALAARLSEDIAERLGEKMALALADIGRGQWLAAATTVSVVTGLAEVAYLRRLERALLRRPREMADDASGIKTTDRRFRSAWPPPRLRG